MPNAERKHRCGGTLVPAEIMIVDEDGKMLLHYAVVGFVCDKCHEKLIERETVRAIQNAQTPVVAWNVPAPATTYLDETILDLMPAPAGTASVLA
jgi:hypothetical protein